MTCWGELQRCWLHLTPHLCCQKALLSSSPYSRAYTPLTFMCQLSSATVLFVSLVTFCLSLKFSPRTTDQESDASELPNLWLYPGASQGTFPKCCWIFWKRAHTKCLGRWGKTWNLGQTFCLSLLRKPLGFFYCQVSQELELTASCWCRDTINHLSPRCGGPWCTMVLNYGQSQSVAKWRQNWLKKKKKKGESPRPSWK